MSIRWLKMMVSIGPFCLTSCFGLFDSGSDHIVDNYEVTWIDEHSHRALYRGIEEIVPAYVAAVGFDAKYLFVRQHPITGDHDEQVVESITNYYLIRRNGDDIVDKPKPLSETEFNMLCRKLGVRKIEFSTQYPENI